MESHSFYFSLRRRSQNRWTAQFGGLQLAEGALMEHRAVTPERPRLMKRQVVHRLRSRSSEQHYVLFFCCCLFIADIKQSRGPWYEQNASSFLLKWTPISIHKVTALYCFFSHMQWLFPKLVASPFKYSWKKLMLSDWIVGNTVQLPQNMTSLGRPYVATFVRFFFSKIRPCVPTFPWVRVSPTPRKCGSTGANFGRKKKVLEMWEHRHAPNQSTCVKNASYF